MPDVTSSSDNSYKIAVRFGDAVLQAGFTSVPNLVLDNYARLGISPAEMMFTIHIWQHWWTEKDPYPSLNTIAAKMDVTRRQVRNYAQNLREKGYLHVRERYIAGLGQVTSEYDFSLLLDAVIALAQGEVETVDPPRKNITQGGRKNISGAPRQEISSEEYSAKEDKDQEDIYPSKIRNDKSGKKDQDYVNQDRTDNQMKSTQAGQGNFSLSAEVGGKDTGSPARFYDVAYDDGLNIEAEKHQSKHRTLHPQQQDTPRSARDQGFEPVGATIERSSTRRGRQRAGDEDRQFFVDVWEQLGDELNDQAKMTSSVSQVLNIYRAWHERTGGNREAFLNLLDEARSRTKERSGSIRLKENKGGDWALKNRAPYFFAILRDLAGIVEKPQETP